MITSRVMAFIMAGGMGDRLSVLSEQRAKPAVPFGGSFRIIDFALSNCANSGITRVGVLTQYLPRSLNEHIGSGGPWGLDRDEEGVMILQPYQSADARWEWYRGTADAIYQNLFEIRDYGADTVLVLAGDHVYSTDYRPMIDFHREHDADVTVGVTRVRAADASRFGLVTVDGEDRVRGFEEKPEHPSHDLVSMGFYAFKASYLFDVLIADAANASSAHDFGHDILPATVKSGAGVLAYPFDGYWRDIGDRGGVLGGEHGTARRPDADPLRSAGRARVHPSPEPAIGAIRPGCRGAAGHHRARLRRARIGGALDPLPRRHRRGRSGRA